MSRHADRVARRLMAYCPLRAPVHILTGLPVPPPYADTDWSGVRFIIRIDPSLDDCSVTETLAHEWAHAMTWTTTRVDHGEVWGKAHSRAYRVAVEKWEPKS